MSEIFCLSDFNEIKTHLNLKKERKKEKYMTCNEIKVDHFFLLCSCGESVESACSINLKQPETQT